MKFKKKTMIFVMLFIIIISLSFLSVNASYANTEIQKTELNTNTDDSNNGFNEIEITNIVKNTESPKATGEVEQLTQNQVLVASKSVNSFINTNKKLPNYVTIAGCNFSMEEYMYILSKTIYLKYNKKTSNIVVKYNIKDPTLPNGANINGKITKAYYYKYAKSLISYVDKNNQIPNYISTKIGKIQYQTAVFAFNKIIYYCAINKGVLPLNVGFNVKKTHSLNKNLPKLPVYNIAPTNNRNTINNDDGIFDINISADNAKSVNGPILLVSIIDAASRVKNFVETNGVLPNYVTIASNQYTMPQFLYLLSTGIKNLASGSTNSVNLITVNAPLSPSGDAITGVLSKTDYVSLATRVSNYIATNNRVPNYASSSLGNIQYQSLVYELSKVLNFYNINGFLPNSLSINTRYPPNLNV